MRLAPRSLGGRLFAIGGLFTLAALAVAAVAIGQVLERWVVAGLDQQLDAQVLMLARAIGPDGRLRPALVNDLPAFAGPRTPGWGWRVDGVGEAVMAGDPARLSATPPPPAPAPDPAAPPGPPRAPVPPSPPPAPGVIHPGDGRARSGTAVHYRLLHLPTPAGDVAVLANAPRRIALAPLRQALPPLLLCLALLGAALLVASWAQLRLGLRPLRALAAGVAAVRQGEADRVADDQPAELRPLAAELNALVTANSAGLERARRHAANLAHGLKTPLAAMLLELREPGRDPDGRLAALVADMDRRIRHHLARARANALGRPARTPLAPAVAAILDVLARLHADRPLAVTTQALDQSVAVDAQDLDEMLGNLLDNGWRHARAQLAVRAERVGQQVLVVVADDGPGLRPDQLAEALAPGRRLDEADGGHGFGLAITRELAELNGGDLRLGQDAALGGLAAGLALPVAR